MPRSFYEVIEFCVSVCVIRLWRNQTKGHVLILTKAKKVLLEAAVIAN